jgi:hypothetical protein
MDCLRADGKGRVMNGDALKDRRFVDLAVAALSLVAATVTLTGVTGTAQAALVLVAVVAGLGWSLTGWVRSTDVAFVTSVSAATGVAAITLIAMLCMELRWWHPVGLTIALLYAAAGASLAYAVMRSLRRA